LQQIMPTSAELVEFLRQSYNLTISDNNILKLNVKDVLTLANATFLNATIPAVNLTQLFPNFDWSDIEELDLPINDVSTELEGQRIGDLLDGTVDISLTQLL